MLSQRKPNQTDRKNVDRVERRAANRTGIGYGSRNAGGASEHFEVGRGKHATSSSKKQQKGKGERRKTKEQRITSG
jgi:hypothetical protein